MEWGSVSRQSRRRTIGGETLRYKVCVMERSQTKVRMYRFLSANVRRTNTLSSEGNASQRYTGNDDSYGRVDKVTCMAERTEATKYSRPAELEYFRQRLWGDVSTKPEYSLILSIFKSNGER